MSGIKYDVRVTIMSGSWYCYNENMLKKIIKWASRHKPVPSQPRPRLHLKNQSEKIMEMSRAPQTPSFSLPYICIT